MRVSGPEGTAAAVLRRGVKKNTGDMTAGFCVWRKFGKEFMGALASALGEFIRKW
jgi:hypothetical protein